MVEELKTVEDVADYQRALMASFEAGEISAEKLKAGMYASKLLIETLIKVKRYGRQPEDLDFTV